jgi:type III restriction enzyme
MASATIDRLIINSPYEEPSQHWLYERQTRSWALPTGRRPAGYLVATPGSRAFDDPGVFREIPLVNQIRPRVKAWCDAGYPDATGVTRRLLEHWHEPEERRDRRFFFCQLEAIETLIWLAESPPADRVGIDIPGDGGLFQRLCSKMATGTGKTVVMSMLIAWQVLNKVTYPQDTRFAKNILVIAPGLTIRRRLQVLVPSNTGNYYDEFNIVPPGLVDALRQAKVRVRNWHALNWESSEQLARKKSVDKRGPKSDEAYVRDVLGEMASARNLVVINDEAHHAWRMAQGSKLRGVSKDDADQAAKWIGGLDRIHRARGILRCYDFSATPFIPTGGASSEEALYGWIVSDFGLTDAIESGLVKTPRVVVRDDATPDAKTYRSRLYHIYMDPEVHDNLNRKALETDSLPDLVVNAYLLLGWDWLEAKKLWAATQPVPPVMITVANRTETAARVAYAMQTKRFLPPPLHDLGDPQRTLHIDSKVLNEAEEREEPLTVNGSPTASEDAEDGGQAEGTLKLTREQKAAKLREQVDTVGQPGKAGARLQHVISVGMLSEGWDAKTVTHIMGLRAFSSQLLCEQVVGRGLRRTSYEVQEEGESKGLFKPDYVNIFGVPFTFLPHEGGDGPPPPPPPPTTRVEPVPEKAQYEITFPNVVRVEHVVRQRLDLDLAKLTPLTLNASQTVTVAELAAMLEGKPNLASLSQIELEHLAGQLRLQQIIFKTAANVYDQLRPSWKGSKEFLVAQVIPLVEQFINSDMVRFAPPLFNSDPLRRRLLLTLQMDKVVQQVCAAIQAQNEETLEPIFDDTRPIRSTEDMRPWYTGRPCEYAKRSHINFCVYDSTWEASEAFVLDRNPHISAWVKNDHLGFEINYIYRGVRKKYRPDFLVRSVDGRMLVLEVKGQPTEEATVKRQALEEWVRAVNSHGGFGRWCSGVSYLPKDTADVLEKQFAGTGA